MKGSITVEPDQQIATKKILILLLFLKLEIELFTGKTYNTQIKKRKNPKNNAFTLKKNKEYKRKNPIIKLNI
tara:strand:- start:707 stop:922 length:216 start_codon:yes stop_codon:yes gene_type:complete